MVIVGAGASYGSRSEAEISAALRPPLTKDLLDLGIVGAYPGVRAVRQRVRNLLEDDPETGLEGALATIAEHVGRGSTVQNHLLAFRFYLDDVIRETTTAWSQEGDGTTYYDALVSRLGTWQEQTGEPIAIVSFNYDTLLEQAVQEFLAEPLPLDSFDGYVRRPDWRIYKPHGSIQWSRIANSGLDSDPATLIRHARDLGGDFSKWELRPVPRTEQPTPGRITVPAIALPTTAKQTYECPLEHIKMLSNDMTTVDRMLIIGWRGAEPMVHALLSTTRPGLQLAVCAPDVPECAEILDRLEVVARRCYQPWAISGGFEWLLRQGTLTRWLGTTPGAQPSDYDESPYKSIRALAVIKHALDAVTAPSRRVHMSAMPLRR